MTRLLRSALLVLPLTSVGCDFFENTRDAFDDLTNPLVGLGLILGVDEPSDVDLDGAGLEVGTTFSMFLADAASADDLDNAPVNGALVTLEGVQTDEGVDGLYLLGPDRAPAYAGSAIFDVNIGEGQGAATARIRLPEGANFSSVLGHTPGAGIDVDLSGQGFNAAIVVVIESSTGTLTYSTEPETAREVYDLTRGNGDVGTVSIPGEAFPEANEVYVVGISGLAHADGSDIDGLNSVLSSLSAGLMVFEPVSTFPDVQ